MNQLKMQKHPIVNRSLLIFIIFLCNLNISTCQIVKGANLFIDEHTNISTLIYVKTDSVKRIYFNKAKIISLDSNWTKLANVKEIHFSQNSVIPKNLSVIKNAVKIEFSNYKNPLKLPKDFPFNSYIDVSFSFMTSMPIFINKFINIKSLHVHAMTDSLILKKISKVGQQLKLLSLSEVRLKKNDFCNFSDLENLELSMINFCENELIIDCLTSLKEINVEGTNLAKIQMNSSNLNLIYLHNNKMSPEEIKLIKTKYSNIKTVIW